jgi:hypothetical protein
MTLREFMHELRRCAPRYYWNVTLGHVRGVNKFSVVCPITAVIEFRTGMCLSCVRAATYGEEKLGMHPAVSRMLVEASDNKLTPDSEYLRNLARLRRRLLTMVRLPREL